VLSTAKNTLITSDTIFIALIPLFVEAPGRATEGRPYLPPAVERFYRCVLIFGRAGFRAPLNS
jgi:hypothetical protein